MDSNTAASTKPGTSSLESKPQNGFGDILLPVGKEVVETLGKKYLEKGYDGVVDQTTNIAAQGCFACMGSLCVCASGMKCIGKCIPKCLKTRCKKKKKTDNSKEFKEIRENQEKLFAIVNELVQKEKSKVKENEEFKKKVLEKWENHENQQRVRYEAMNMQNNQILGYLERIDLQREQEKIDRQIEDATREVKNQESIDSIHQKLNQIEKNLNRLQEEVETGKSCVVEQVEQIKQEASQHENETLQNHFKMQADVLLTVRNELAEYLEDEFNTQTGKQEQLKNELMLGQQEIKKSMESMVFVESNVIKVELTQMRENMCALFKNLEQFEITGFTHTQKIEEIKNLQEIYFSKILNTCNENSNCLKNISQFPTENMKSSIKRQRWFQSTTPIHSEEALITFDSTQTITSPVSTASSNDWAQKMEEESEVDSMQPTLDTLSPSLEENSANEQDGTLAEQNLAIQDENAESDELGKLIIGHLKK